MKQKSLNILLIGLKKKNIELTKDKQGNILLRKPATKGMENKKSICLQGHLDMVCVKAENYEIDFDKDPIQPYVAEEHGIKWVKAKNTSLGADDGIAIAMFMALLDSDDIQHPDLEILCTLDEEAGMTGAGNLDASLLKSNILINVDSEEEGYFTIGCAGGVNTSAVYNFYEHDKDAVPYNCVAHKITVSGLLGGHSGVEINTGRANALKILTRILWHVTRNLNVRIFDINSGEAHNAIPKSATSTVVIPKNNLEKYESYLKEISQKVQNEFKEVEKSISISSVAENMPDKVWGKELQFKILNALYAIIHGVWRMSPNPSTPDLVQTSTNLAIIKTEKNKVTVLTSQRSSVESEKENIKNQVISTFELSGAAVETSDGYPGWEPNFDSEILKISEKVYKQMFLTKEPIIQTIHAGLECGIIGVKYPKMDMISIGPNLFDVHSINERLDISSTKLAWDFLLEVLKNAPEK